MGKFIAHDEKWITERVREVAPGFEYLRGYQTIDKKAWIRCRKCGNETYTSMQFLKKDKWKPKCLECQKAETIEKNRKKREEIQKTRKLQHDQARQQKKVDELLAKGTQARMSICPRCNALFIPRKRGQQYCTGRCGSLAHYALKKDRRLKKMREVVIDKGITLQALYQRDNGKCWICGKPCDYTAGTNANEYPSIDHVKPLAKGGKHSWDNVRLAHRICNSKKKDRIIEAGT